MSVEKKRVKWWTYVWTRSEMKVTDDLWQVLVVVSCLGRQSSPSFAAEKLVRTKVIKSGVRSRLQSFLLILFVLVNYNYECPNVSQPESNSQNLIFVNEYVYRKYFVYDCYQ